MGVLEVDLTGLCMSSRALISEHMHYRADINSMATIKKIVMRLQSHLQAKWAEVSNKLIEAGIKSEFFSPDWLRREKSHCGKHCVWQVGGS